MTTFVVRVWLPDRPGALGAVTSRVGAVGGDVVGIEILERGVGRAIDELVVTLDRPELLDLLVNEILQVDGVEIESAQPLDDARRDPLLDALETAAVLVGAGSPAAAVDSLVEHATRITGSRWGAALSLDHGLIEARTGPSPDAASLSGVVLGHQEAAGELVWAPLPAARLALVLGRESVAFRARERRQVAALARIVDTRFAELRRAARPASSGQS
jgi:hypothetical protein